MFKIIERIAKASRTVSLVNANIEKLRNYATIQMRDILIDRHEEAGTLFLNYAKHIALERQKSCDPIKTTIKYSTYFPITDNRYFRNELEKTPANQLAALFIFASIYRTNAQPQLLLNMINELDDAACRQLNKMTNEDILNSLYGLLYFAPNWLSRMNFYRLGLEKLVENFQGSETVEHFVQLCFYLGVQKKRNILHNNELKNLLDQHLDKYITKLSLMDLAIVSNAAFKTATVIDSALYNDHLETNAIAFQFDGKNEALFVNFLKAMRLQKVRSTKVCQRLVELSQNPEEFDNLETRGLAHVLVFLAENSWDHPATLEVITRRFLKNIQNNVLDCREKDISMFTWCCAQLNINLSMEELQFLESSLVKKINEGKFKTFPDQLIDACLSLWVLGHKCEQLLISAIRQKASAAKRTGLQPKVDNRLKVLMTACAIEEPQLVEAYTNIKEAYDKNNKIPSYILKQNTELYGIMECLSAYNSIKNVKMIMPLNGINIPNLLIEMNSSNDDRGNVNSTEQIPKENLNEILLEFVKPEQILHFSKQAVPLIRLKKRLLESLGYKVIFVQAEDLQDNCSLLKDHLCSNNSHDLEEKKIVLNNLN